MKMCEVPWVGTGVFTNLMHFFKLIISWTFIIVIVNIFAKLLYSIEQKRGMRVSNVLLSGGPFFPEIGRNILFYIN